MVTIAVVMVTLVAVTAPRTISVVAIAVIASVMTEEGKSTEKTI